jgi:hypothetical protein
VEFSPCLWWLGKQTYSYPGSTKIWITLPQLQGFFFMILLALADADYKFLLALVTEYGSASDCQVFNKSELRELVEGG